MKEIKLSELKFLRLKGFKMKEIAKFYGISEPTLGKIIKKYNIPRKSISGSKIKIIEDLKENEEKDYSHLIKEIKQKKENNKTNFY